VSDCPNFTPDSLIDFLLHLEGAHVSVALEELVVTGDQSPKLETPAQLQWARSLALKKLDWRPMTACH
jgi:hypothetical protein